MIFVSFDFRIATCGLSERYASKARVMRVNVVLQERKFSQSGFSSAKALIFSSISPSSAQFIVVGETHVIKIFIPYLT